MSASTFTIKVRSETESQVRITIRHDHIRWVYELPEADVPEGGAGIAADAGVEFRTIESYDEVMETLLHDGWLES